MPCLLPNPWELLLRLLILLCYASRRGLGLSVFHERCEIINLMVYLRWQLKLTSGWSEAPGESSVVCLYKDRHPGSKGTEIFHARNFRVQPQTIMGSSIVE